MNIYTSYFAKLKDLPNNVVPISICGKAPDWYTGLQYKRLAPKYDFFMQWKKNHDNEFYIKNFTERVLNTLDINEVMNDFYIMSKGKDIVLVCYEKPEDFCHRHLVAQWLNEKLNITVEEYKF